MKPKAAGRSKHALFLILLIAASLTFLLASCEKVAKDNEPETPPPTPEPIDPIPALYGHKTQLSDFHARLYDSILMDVASGLPKVRPNTRDMVFIPAGRAIIGAKSHPHGQEQRLDLQTVDLPGFYIDKTEVTNRQYKECIRQHLCLPQGDASHIPGHDGPDNPALLAFMQAKRYCLSVGKRLPTEIEWEKAARGIDGRLYAWGNDLPDPSRANICGEECPATTTQEGWVDPYPGTAPVGSFPAGAGPYGLVDMAGNVKEWVESATPLEENRRIARGASWYSDRTELVTFYRQVWFPQTRLDDKGVRCAADGK